MDLDLNSRPRSKEFLPLQRFSAPLFADKQYPNYKLPSSIPGQGATFVSNFMLFLNEKQKPFKKIEKQSTKSLK